jgi:hypothetical protein
VSVTEKERGVLVGVKMLAALAAAAFGATALLSVWDVSGRFHPLHGFLQNIGLALGSVAVGFLAGYLQMKDDGRGQ